jgi:hypothetical protein
VRFCLALFFSPLLPEGQYRWDFDNDGTWDTDWSSSPTVSKSWDDDFSGVTKVEVSDGKFTASDTATVTVNNVAPTASLNSPDSVDEGSAISLSLINPSDPSSADTTAGLSYAFDCGTGYSEYSSERTASCPTIDNGDLTVKAKIKDKDGGENEYTASVTINNVAPTVTITGPAAGSVYAVDTTITFEGTYGTADIHTAQWSFDSLTSPVQDVFDGSVSTDYSFTAAGVYQVQLTVTDDEGGAGTASTVDGQDAYVVVYDPTAGFVTGGGWINSPVEACPDLCGGASGRANFGFVSRYKKGATTPTGETEFKFKAGNLNFHSTTYDWLVVSGPKAQYKGSGTINGEGNYGFLLTATDGQQPGGGGDDKFRIKIVDKDTDMIVYDNVPGDSDDIDDVKPQVISGGSIVIHR